MPIKVWYKILETADLLHIFKSGVGEITQRIHDVWLDVQQQLYDEFGIEPDFQVIMELQMQLAELQCEFIKTGDRKLLNNILITEHQIKIMTDSEVTKFYDIKDQLERRRRFQIDIDKVTVIEWHYMIKNTFKQPIPVEDGEDD